MVGVVVVAHLPATRPFVLVAVEVNHSREVTCRGMIGSGNGPRHGQFSRGIHLARHDVGYRVATLFSWLPCTDDGVGIALPGSRLNDRSAVDDDYYGFADSMESLAYIDNQLTLLRNKVELCFQVAVDALAGLTANGDDGGIGTLRLLADGDGVDGYLRIFLRPHLLSLEPFGGMALVLELHAGIVDILAVDVGQRLRRLDAGILQTLHHIDHVRSMYTARAYAAGQEVVAVLAEECHIPDVLPGQGTVVLQQHDALASRLTGDGGVRFQVGLVGGWIFVEAWCLHNILQHTAHVAVDVGHRELAALHALNNLVNLGGLSRFHQVVAGLHLSDGGQSLTDANPVGHDDALVAPVVAQDAGQQVAVAHGVLAVHLVIR